MRPRPGCSTYKLGCSKTTVTEHMLAVGYGMEVPVGYGMEALFFSSAWSVDKLNKIQNHALFLCTRPMRNGKYSFDLHATSQ